MKVKYRKTKEVSDAAQVIGYIKWIDHRIFRRIDVVLHGIRGQVMTWKGGWHEIFDCEGMIAAMKSSVAIFALCVERQGWTIVDERASQE